jgi:hypothetical protein
MIIESLKKLHFEVGLSAVYWFLFIYYLIKINVWEVKSLK